MLALVSSNVCLETMCVSLLMFLADSPSVEFSLTNGSVNVHVCFVSGLIESEYQSTFWRRGSREVTPAAD